MKSLVALAGLSLVASVAAPSEPFSFDSPRWQIEAKEHRIEQYKGKTSLVLKGGLALVADSEFSDGVIEYFSAFPEGRAFAGASWRVQDAANREEFYIRTHQSGNPDANQYTPVFNGLSAWQLYHGEGFLGCHVPHCCIVLEEGRKKEGCQKGATYHIVTLGDAKS